MAGLSAIRLGVDNPVPEGAGSVRAGLPPANDPAVAVGVLVDSMAFHHSERCWGTGDVFPSCQKRCHGGIRPPPAKRTDGPENAKTPPEERGFRTCAEEDSNLHPVNPD
jgi:hypothetical protein